MCRDGCINYTLSPYYTVFIELIPSSLAWARILIMTAKAQATIASVGKWKDRQQHFCPPKETIQLGNIDKPQSGIRTTILKKKLSSVVRKQIVLLKMDKVCWRDGSVVENIRCSSKIQFQSPAPTWWLTGIIHSSYRLSEPSSGLLGNKVHLWCINTYGSNIHTQEITNKNFKMSKGCELTFIQMANQYKNECLTQLITREIQIKTAIKYHPITVRVAFIKKKK